MNAKAILLILQLVVCVATPVRARSLSLLEQAVMELPSTAVADIPLRERRVFLDHLRKDTPGNTRLDVQNRFLEFYSDGETPFHATSMLYLKVFRRKDESWIVFCHMPKPNADGRKPALDQTFVYTRRAGKWTDITGETMPKGVDLRWHFRPRRSLDVIEAGPFEKIVTQPGGGHDYLHTRDLIWDGNAFRMQKALRGQFSDNSL